MKFLAEWGKAETDLDFVLYIEDKYHIEVPASY